LQLWHPHHLLTASTMDCRFAHSGFIHS
jgi:hypothetical protein